MREAVKYSLFLDSYNESNATTDTGNVRCHIIITPFAKIDDEVFKLSNDYGPLKFGAVVNTTVLQTSCKFKAVLALIKF